MVALLVAAGATLIAAAIWGGRGAEGSVDDVFSGPTITETEEDPAVVAKKKGDPKATSGPKAAGPAASKGPAAAIPQTPQGERKSEQGATREGVHGDHFEFGVHAPLTFDGAPLNLAEDPITGLKGYITYVNRHGGINGLKIKTVPPRRPLHDVRRRAGSATTSRRDQAVPDRGHARHRPDPQVALGCEGRAGSRTWPAVVPSRS